MMNYCMGNIAAWSWLKEAEISLKKPGSQSGYHKRKLTPALAFQGRQQMSPDRRVRVKCRPQDVF